MRKLIAAVMLAVVIFLCACGDGASVSYYQIKLSGDPETLLLADGKYPAMKEKITYFSGDSEAYSYSLYLEATGNYTYPYSVIETDGDYSLYAREGDIYVEKGGKLYAVLLTVGTYYQYTEKYLSLESDLDGGSFYQLYSEREGDITKVAYYSEILPETAAKYSSLGFSLGDRIVAEYEIYGDYRAKRITYFIEKDGVRDKLMTREFEYLSEPDGEFPDVPDAGRNVHVVYNYGTPIDTYQSFYVPYGCGFGFETGGRNIEFYLDTEFTVPFEYEDSFDPDLTKVYVKNNFN